MMYSGIKQLVESQSCTIHYIFFIVHYMFFITIIVWEVVGHLPWLGRAWRFRGNFSEPTEKPDRVAGRTWRRGPWIYGRVGGRNNPVDISTAWRIVSNGPWTVNKQRKQRYYVREKYKVRYASVIYIYIYMYIYHIKIQYTYTVFK